MNKNIESKVTDGLSWLGAGGGLALVVMGGPFALSGAALFLSTFAGHMITVLRPQSESKRKIKQISLAAGIVSFAALLQPSFNANRENQAKQALFNTASTECTNKGGKVMELIEGNGQHICLRPAAPDATTGSYDLLPAAR